MSGTDPEMVVEEMGQLTSENEASNKPVVAP